MVCLSIQLPRPNIAVGECTAGAADNKAIAMRATSLVTARAAARSRQ